MKTISLFLIHEFWITQVLSPDPATLQAGFPGKPTGAIVGGCSRWRFVPRKRRNMSGLDPSLTASPQDPTQSPAVSPYSILLERLVEMTPQLDTHESGAALERHADQPAADWDATWQDNLTTVAQDIGFRAVPAWLSPAEIAGCLRPNTPAVTFRRTANNPEGWTLLLDRRWGRVFRGNLGGSKDTWLRIEELAASLDLERDSRIPWLFFEPIQSIPTSDHHDSGPTPLRRLIELIRPERSDLWSVVMFAVIVGGLTLATPIAVQQLVNSVALGGLMQPVVVLALLLIAVLGFSAALSVIEAYVVEIIQRRVFVRVVGDIARRLPRVQFDVFDRKNGPELVNRFFDVVTIQKVGATLLLDGIALVLQTAIGLLVLSFYHPLMLAFGVVLVSGIAVIVFAFGRGAVATAIAESKSKYEVAAWLEEIARHANEFKPIGAGRYALERADDLSRNYLRARGAHYRIVLRQLAGAYGLQVVASGALLGLGGGLVIAGTVDAGTTGRIRADRNGDRRLFRQARQASRKLLRLARRVRQARSSLRLAARTNQRRHSRPRESVSRAYLPRGLLRIRRQTATRRVGFRNRARRASGHRWLRWLRKKHRTRPRTRTAIPIRRLHRHRWHRHTRAATGSSARTDCTRERPPDHRGDPRRERSHGTWLRHRTNGSERVASSRPPRSSPSITRRTENQSFRQRCAPVAQRGDARHFGTSHRGPASIAPRRRTAIGPRRPVSRLSSAESSRSQCPLDTGDRNDPRRDRAALRSPCRVDTA